MILFWSYFCYKWDLICEGSKAFGVSAKELTLSKDEVCHALQSGMPIICSMRAERFYLIGHFIILTELEDGNIQVHDPNSKERSERRWDYEILEYQIHNL